MTIQQNKQNDKSGRTSQETRFIWIDKNLCNYPLSRDARVKCDWRKGAETGRWYAHLPGDERITFVFAADGAKRLPTAFDMNVLFLLLAETRKQNRDKIFIGSHSAILNSLGLGVDTNNLRRVRASLTLWSQITIRFKRNYYFAGKSQRIPQWRTGEHGKREEARPRYKNGIHGDKKLPPPIRSIRAGNGLMIRISNDWLQLHKKYLERVPLPLPARSAVQNIVLCVLVSMPSREGDGATKLRSVRKFCRKIGLNHGMRSEVLKHALEEVEDWFKAHGGICVAAIKDRRIAFAISKPGKAVAEGDPEPRTVAEPVVERIPLNRVPSKPRAQVNHVNHGQHLRAARGGLLIRRTPANEPRGVKMHTGVTEDGRKVSWYEQPDGRETRDREGTMAI